MATSSLVIARPAAALREALTCPLCEVRRRASVVNLPGAPGCHVLTGARHSRHQDVLRAAYTAPECMHTCTSRVLAVCWPCSCLAACEEATRA